MALKIKLKKFTAASGSPTTSDLESGEVGINPTQQKIFVNNAGTIVELGSAGVDLSAVAQDIIPDANNTRSLGSSSKRWADLFLSGSTINLGGSTISSDGTGTVTISSTGVSLPEGSKAGDNKLAVVATGSGGAEQVTKIVDFFSQSGGLSSRNSSFLFNATIDNKFVFTGTKTFTLASGSNLSDPNPTLFQF